MTEQSYTTRGLKVCLGLLKKQVSVHFVKRCLDSGPDLIANETYIYSL